MAITIDNTEMDGSPFKVAIIEIVMFKKTSGKIISLHTAASLEKTSSCFYSGVSLL
jgi:hypothetical protein